jgi:hypothetical protein
MVKNTSSRLNPRRLCRDAKENEGTGESEKKGYGDFGKFIGLRRINSQRVSSWLDRWVSGLKVSVGPGTTYSGAFLCKEMGFG